MSLSDIFAPLLIRQLSQSHQTTNRMRERSQAKSSQAKPNKTKPNWGRLDNHTGRTDAYTWAQAQAHAHIHTHIIKKVDIKQVRERVILLIHFTQLCNACREDVCTFTWVPHSLAPCPYYRDVEQTMQLMLQFSHNQFFFAVFASFLCM